MRLLEEVGVGELDRQGVEGNEGDAAGDLADPPAETVQDRRRQMAPQEVGQRNLEEDQGDARPAAGRDEIADVPGLRSVEPEGAVAQEVADEVTGPRVGDGVGPERSIGQGGVEMGAFAAGGAGEDAAAEQVADRCGPARGGGLEPVGEDAAGLVAIAQDSKGATEVVAKNDREQPDGLVWGGAELPLPLGPVPEEGDLWGRIVSLEELAGRDAEKDELRPAPAEEQADDGLGLAGLGAGAGVVGGGDRAAEAAGAGLGDPFGHDGLAGAAGADDADVGRAAEFDGLRDGGVLDLADGVGDERVGGELSRGDFDEGDEKEGERQGPREAGGQRRPIGVRSGIGED